MKNRQKTEDRKDEHLFLTPVARCLTQAAPDTDSLRQQSLPVRRTSATKANSAAGFTLLLAALVASIVLAISVSIFGIAQKQVTLSSMGRDSQFAFYTADTGAECALYWDIRHGFFGTTPPPGSAICDNQTLDISGRSESYPYTMSFQFEPGGFCARVTVKKDEVDPRTVIHSDGFSTDCASIDGSPRTLQRSVELRY